MRFTASKSAVFAPSMTMAFVVAVLVLLAMAMANVAHAARSPRVQVCHIPPGNPDNFHTITVSEKALPAHLAHGDLSGACLTCEPGFFRSGDNCEACPIGQYNDETSMADSCTACPDGMTTAGEGSPSIDSCIDPIVSCGPGTFRDGDACNLCPVGTYNAETSPTAVCTACPDGSTTLQTGSTSPDACVQDCSPAPGIEKDPVSGRCELCDYGWYKETDDLEPCLECPPWAEFTENRGTVFERHCVVEDPNE